MNAYGLVMAFVMALAQVGAAEPQITGQGVQEASVLPSAVQLVIRFQAKGTKLDDVIADIQSQTDSAMKKLAEMNPVKDTLVADGPELLAPDETGQSGLARAVMQRRFSPAPAEQGKEGEAPSLTLSTTVKAEWALASGDLTSILREAEKIKQAVTAAFPEKPKAEEEMTEEEQEEMLARTAGGSEEQLTPGKPSFFYVGRLPAGALDKARRQAFVKARDSAKGTADAAGVALGALAGVACNVNSSREDAYTWRYAMMMGIGEPGSETEARSPSLRAMKFYVTITAMFKVAASS
jgi:hypothetical protein